jgi:hypothetical protein
MSYIEDMSGRFVATAGTKVAITRSTFQANNKHIKTSLNGNNYYSIKNL